MYGLVLSKEKTQKTPQTPMNRTTSPIVLVPPMHGVLAKREFSYALPTIASFLIAMARRKPPITSHLYCIYFQIKSAHSEAPPPPNYPREGSEPHILYYSRISTHHPSQCKKKGSKPHLSSYSRTIILFQNFHPHISTQLTRLFRCQQRHKKQRVQYDILYYSRNFHTPPRPSLPIQAKGSKTSLIIPSSTIPPNPTNAPFLPFPSQCKHNKSQKVYLKLRLSYIQT